MKVGFLPCAFWDSCSRDRNLVSPDVTVEQEALSSLPKSYHCIQVAGAGSWLWAGSERLTS